MGDDEKVERLMFTGVRRDEAELFLKLYDAMKPIEVDEAEEERIKHAREMSRPRGY